MKYRIVSTTKIDILTDRVNNLLKEGWVCQGGICVLQPGTGSYLSCDYYQAMTFDEKHDGKF